MPGLDTLDTLFVIVAFATQAILLAHFAIRKWAFDTAMRYGWLVYAIFIPAVLLGIMLWLGGKPWYLWLAGVLHTVWALFGLTVEFFLKITDWRSPVRWSILIPYVGLYLAFQMFYWWPLGTLWRPLWYVYALLFVANTVLNVTSHKRPDT